MRKFYILLIASMVAMAGFAQQKALQMSPKLAFTPKEAVKGDFPFVNTHKMKPFSPGFKAQPSRADVITEQPEGELKLYQREGGAFYSVWGYIFTTYQDGGALQMVYADDGKTVYIQDPVSQSPMGSWVKAELSEDGKKITLPLGQFTYYSKNFPCGFMLGVVHVTRNDEGTFDYVYEEDVTEVTFTVDGDKISLDDTYGDFSSYDCRGLGVVWDDDLTWIGYMDFNSVYTLFTDEVTTIPEGTTLEDWSMTWVGDNGREGKMVKGAIVGNDVYIQDFSEYVPEGVIKGTISNGVATFPSMQYVGMGSSMFFYMDGITQENDGYYILKNLTFDYDAASTTLTSSDIMGIVTGSTIYELYDEPIFNKYVDHAATPADPSVLSFTDEGSADGYNYGKFYIPLEDTDGNFMNPDDVYYRIYVDDDELFVFGPGEYPALSEDMTEIPYSFTDNFDIGSAASTIYFYETGFWRIGIQTVFRGGGEEHASNIVYLDLSKTNDPGDVKQIYSEYFGEEDFSNIGISRAEGYDVAMKVTDASLEGKVVKGIRFRIPDSEFNGTDFAGWLSNKLAVEQRNGIGRAAADITWKDVEVTGNVVEVIFDEPYTIGKDGFYAGYSFIIPELIDTYDNYPIVYTAVTKEEGFWLHTSRSYRAWQDFSEDYGTTIELLLAGDNVYENAAVLKHNKTDYYVKAGDVLSMNMTLFNHGTNDLANITYKYNIDGLSESVDMTLDTPLSGDYYGRSTNVTVSLPAIETTGEYTLRLTTTKANGAANLDPCAEQYATVHVLDFVPTKRPLMEEYTSTWYGWCTRSYIAMREIDKKYGDDVVTVSLHHNDPMAAIATSDWPNDVSSYPNSYIDRALNVDPFYGLDESESSSLGICDVLDEQMTQLAEAEIDMKSSWRDEDRSTLDVTVEARFIANYDNAPYAIEWMILEDGMTGEAGTDWDQTNFYSGFTSKYGSDPYLKEITEWPDMVEGLEFNDVLLCTSGHVSGSLPSTIVAGETYSYSDYVQPALIYNLDGEAMVQNLDKLSVVALVVNTETGAIVNAIKEPVGKSVGVVEKLNADKQVDSITYYDLQGRQVTNPSGGFYIQSVRFTDGTSVNVKVLKR